MEAGHAVTGHPVDVGSGVVFTTSHDFELTGSMNFVWSRQYATSSAVNSWLGRGWSAPYFMVLERVPEGYRLTDEVGTPVLFPIGDGDLRVGDVVVDLGTNMELR